MPGSEYKKRLPPHLMPSTAFSINFMALMKTLLLASTLVATDLSRAAANPLPGKGSSASKPWHFLWNTPPPADYVDSKTLSCSTGGKAWPIDNERAWPIQKLIIHSSPGVINGVTVTYQGSQAITHGEAVGTLANQILEVPVDKWVSDIKVGCTGGKLTYISFGDGTTTIEAGKSDNVQTWGGKWNAAFQFTGTVNDGALASFGANFSEVENPDED